tara:strand:- start:421 stop:627 length:207 start_codon:yes stop_codon:yes gene_type:complete
MKYVKRLLLLFVTLIQACNYKYEGNNEVIKNIIASQNYEGEIVNLIIYALLTIFLFFVIGYIGNKKNK